MDVNVIAQMITSFGFPMVMCAALCWYVYKVQTKLTDIVNENTAAIRELVYKLDFMRIEGGDKDDGK